MTKNEFLSIFTSVLEKNQVLDVGEIIEEYEQHFSLKLADGYSEEEIAAKLGDPEQLAMQYERSTTSSSKHNGAITKIEMGFADVFMGLFFLLLAICGIVIFAIAISFIVIGVCMIIGASPYSLIPAIPYWCGVIIGVALVSLGVLSATGCNYYWMFVKQLARSFGRFQHNVIAKATGNPFLPSLSAHIQLVPEAKHRLRRLTLILLLIFAVFLVLGFMTCVLSAGNIEFWHEWEWFGYIN